MDSKDAGSVIRLPVASLHLDPMNPRLPPEAQGDRLTQGEIALYINRNYEPLRIAESIANHQFFESEPLIAVLTDGIYVVIEGNRRLTALKGLEDAELLEQFALENSGWKALRGQVGPKEVPVLVVENANDVAPLLGFRHISGIEPWDPYAQARYIAGLVDGGKTLEEVADLVGRNPTEVKSKYRDFDILEQADSVFKIDTRRARKAFGVFSNAMGRTAVRAFIGAQPPRNVNPDNYPLPDSAGPNLRILLSLIFGDPTPSNRAISDSRQLGDLAKVLSDGTGRALAILIETRSLEDALDAASDPHDQFLRAVQKAHKYTSAAWALNESAGSERTRAMLREIVDKASELLELDRHEEAS